MPSVWESTAWKTRRARMSAAGCGHRPLRGTAYGGLLLGSQRPPGRAGRSTVAPDHVHRELDRLHELDLRVPSQQGSELGLTALQRSKLETVLSAGLGSLEILKKAGVKIGFGSDLLGPLREMQSMEFEIRNEVLPAREILAGATTVAAEVLGRTADLGVIAPGALADLILVDGDPTENISLLGNDGRHLALIMANGRIVKNTA
jgi:imidazolonepropionase-like amidohydrolase